MNKRIRKKQTPKSIYILKIHGGEFDLTSRLYAYSDINSLHEDLKKVKSHASASGNYLLPDDLNYDAMYAEKGRWPIARYDITKLNIGASPMKDPAFVESLNYAIDNYDENNVRESEDLEW